MYAPFARESNARAHGDRRVHVKEINCAARVRSGEKCDFNPEGIFEREKIRKLKAKENLIYNAASQANWL